MKMILIKKLKQKQTKNPDLPRIPLTITTRWSAEAESENLQLQTSRLPSTDSDKQTPFPTSPFSISVAIRKLERRQIGKSSWRWKTEFSRSGSWAFLGKIWQRKCEKTWKMERERGKKKPETSVTVLDRRRRNTWEQRKLPLLLLNQEGNDFNRGRWTWN